MVFAALILVAVGAIVKTRIDRADAYIDAQAQAKPPAPKTKPTKTATTEAPYAF